MTDRIKKGGLEIAAELHDLVANEIAPGTGVEADHFWTQMENILADLVPRNEMPAAWQPRRRTFTVVVTW